MSKITRYKMVVKKLECGKELSELIRGTSGEYVLFDDINEFLKPASNSDYMSALRVLEEYHGTPDTMGYFGGFKSWIKQRLNAAIQKAQHCT